MTTGNSLTDAVTRIPREYHSEEEAIRAAKEYIDQQAVAEEVAASRRLCAKHNWPLIDVTRRSIEETAAAVLALLSERRRHAAS